jgi:hypothetical protein
MLWFRDTASLVPLWSLRRQRELVYERTMRLATGIGMQQFIRNADSELAQYGNSVDLVRHREDRFRLQRQPEFQRAGLIAQRVPDRQSEPILFALAHLGVGQQDSWRYQQRILRGFPMRKVPRRAKSRPLVIAAFQESLHRL